MTGPFPEDSAERKMYPAHAVIAGYFPAALAAVAHHSYLGNEKHNPGESLHWARGKSDDHLDAAMRHLIEGDLVGAAWRVLAALQLQREAEGAPVAPLARNAKTEEWGTLRITTMDGGNHDVKVPPRAFARPFYQDDGA